MGDIDVEAIDVDALPLTQYLIIETLAARHRLGEPFWTFPNRVKPMLRKLADAGWVSFESAVTNDVRARLTDAGRVGAFDGRYSAPLETELAHLRSVVAGVEALAEKLEAEANAMCPSDDWPSSGDITAAPFSDALRLTVRRLRSVLSDTRKEPQA